MQYLLSQEEYEALVPKVELTMASHSLAAAREAILDLADFDCIHKPGGRNENGYCSDCPCSSVAPGRDYETWERICWLPKNYAK